MGEWNKYKIGDVCDISSSKRIFAEEYCNKGIPFYRGKEIIEKHNGNEPSTELFISQDRYTEIVSKHGAPIPGDLLLTSVGTLGVPYIVKNETFYFKDGNLTWFQNFRGINSMYLYYWFHSIHAKQQIDGKCIGSTQKALTIDTLRNFEISLPSIETQNRIVGVLKSIDDKIELNNRINHNLEEQAQALYKSWFVDFVPFKDGKFVESEIGMIPEGWAVVSFKDFLTPVSRKVPVGMYPEYSVTNNGIIPRSEKFKKQLSGNSSQNKQLRKYDIVFGMSREILNWGIMLDEIGSVSSAYNIYDINENVIHPLYLRYYMEQRSAYFNDLIGTAAREGQSLDKGALMQKYAIIPPGNALSSFMEREKTYRERIAANESETSSLESIRDSILPRLLCGELNINEIDC